MRKVLKKSFFLFVALSMVVGNSGLSLSFNLLPAARAAEKEVEKTTVPDKYTVCHATGEGHYNELNISESAMHGHFDNNGTPLAGHEDDILLGLDNDHSLHCPQPEPESYPAPVVSAAFTSEGDVEVTWTIDPGEDFYQYKVIVAEHDPSPDTLHYPDDGYMSPAIGDPNQKSRIVPKSGPASVGGDFDGTLDCGQTYYFSVTARYNHGDDQEAGNTVALTVQCDEPPVCGNGILEEGEACDDGNTVTEYCGDETLQVGDYCNADCSEPLTLDEQCDDGPNGSESCTSQCTIPEIPEEPYAPWCSALLGIVRESLNTGVYNNVADINNDQVVNLSDVGFVTQMYYQADNDVCYQEFDDPEGGFQFQCEDPNVGWCEGLVQGITDSQGANKGDDKYFHVFDLNGDETIDLSDLGIATSYGDDNVACYAHYVPPFEMCPDQEGPAICGVKYNDANKDARQGEEESNLSGWTINLYEKTSCQEGDQWADSVVAYNPGPNVPADRSDANKALGVAENNDTMNFVSLGLGGELILQFDNLIENGAGDDIKVFETSYNNPSCSSYPEYVSVYASQDGQNWTSLGDPKCQYGDPTFDLGSLAWAKYVKLVDASSSTPDGFDVDGVEALNCLNASQKPLASTETTENGYCFENLDIGQYMVCEQMQDGWTNSTPLCQQVALDENSGTVDVNFGNYYQTTPPEPGTPYAPWCSALFGAFHAYYDSNSPAYMVYNHVIDLNDDGKIDLIDDGMLTKLYDQGDDDLCYQEFDDPEGGFQFQCEDPNVGWCEGLVQGVKDSIGGDAQDPNSNYSTLFDLNDDGVINVSDVGMAAQLLYAGDEVACYAYYVPPFEMCPISDNTPPVITLIGDATVYVYVGDSYTDAGATADDAEEGDLTGDIVTSGSVDTGTVGSYIIAYNVSDSEGLAADEVTRTVVVQNRGGGCTGNCGGGGSALAYPSNIKATVSCENVTISWDTSKDSLTWILDGLTDTYGDEYKNNEYTPTHSINLAGLDAGTTYHYVVKTQTVDDQVLTDYDRTFTTPPAEQCGSVLGEKIEETPEPEVLGDKEEVCNFIRPSGSHGPDQDVLGVYDFPDGSLLRDACRQEMYVYLIRDQKKWHVPSWEYLDEHFLGQRIYNVLTSVIDAYQDWNGSVLGEKIYGDGTLLRTPDKKIYVIKSGTAHYIKNLKELFQYAGQPITNVDYPVLEAYQ